MNLNQVVDPDQLFSGPVVSQDTHGKNSTICHDSGFSGALSSSNATAVSGKFSNNSCYVIFLFY